MKILNTFPQNYAQIETVFPNCEKCKALFCYGDNIHNPFNAKVTRDLEVHEEVHSKQQGQDPADWWNKYLTDRDFRLEQEIPAYGTQFKFFKDNLRGKQVDWLLDKLTVSLSGDLYGNMLTYGQANSKIRHYAKNLNELTEFSRNVK